MRRHLILLASLFGMTVAASGTSAAPVSGTTILDQLRSASPIEPARVFCYNRVTGRFLHWGSCAPRRRIVVRPRVFCYNRVTGRFLHWGHC